MLLARLPTAGTWWTLKSLDYVGTSATFAPNHLNHIVMRSAHCAHDGLYASLDMFIGFFVFGFHNRSAAATFCNAAALWRHDDLIIILLSCPDERGQRRPMASAAAMVTWLSMHALS